jgi:serine/threonine protein kinase
MNVISYSVTIFHHQIIYYQQSIMEIKVGGHYKLIKKIDSGSFGEIYKGLNTKNNTDVAIKL